MKPYNYSVCADDYQDIEGDFKRMTINQFYREYHNDYYVRYESEVDIDPNKSYIDLRDKEYYEIANKFRWDALNDKAEFKRVQPNEQEDEMFRDAVQFKQINSGLTLGEMLICLVHDYKFRYQEEDSPITKEIIYNTAKKVIEGNYTATATKKRSKVNMAWFDRNQIQASRQKKCGMAMRAMTDDNIVALYDPNKSIEENMKDMKSNGCTSKKERIIEALAAKGMEYYSNNNRERQKAIREAVVKMCRAFPDMTQQKMVEVLKSDGVEVSQSTIQRIKKTLNCEG